MDTDAASAAYTRLLWIIERKANHRSGDALLVAINLAYLDF